MSVEVETTGEVALSRHYRTIEALKLLKSLTEAGKAVIAPEGRYGTKGGKLAYVAEVQKYDVRMYERIYERVEIVRSTIHRLVELITEVGLWVGPPESVIRKGKEPSEVLKENIAFTTQWIRYKKFKSWLGEALKCTMWAGNSYSEIVREKTQEKGSVESRKSWKIKELKLINPAEMRPVRDAFGEVLGYVQFPFYGTRTWLSGAQKERYLQNGGIWFETWEIVHMKINPLPGDVYGTSVLESIKDLMGLIVGMREDIATIIKNYAAPTILFKIGTELIPASLPTVTKFRDMIESQMSASSNIVTSTMVDASVIEAAKNVMNLEGYMRMAQNMLYGALGVPEILMGQGNETTEATAKMQMEAVSKQVRSWHQMIKDEVELQVFSELSVGKKYSELSPVDLEKIPELYFGPVETAEEKRLRLHNGYETGILTREECRKEVGLTPVVEGTIHPNADPKFQMELADKQKEMGMAMAASGPKGTTTKKTKKPSDRDAEHGKAAASSTKKRK